MKKFIILCFVTVFSLLSVCPVTVDAKAYKYLKNTYSNKLDKYNGKKIDKVVYKYELKYPSFNSKAKSKKKINRYFEKYWDKQQKGTGDMSKAASDYYKLQYDQGCEKYFSCWYDKHNIKVTYNKKGKISCKEKVVSFSGNIVYSYIYSHNFNSKTGKKIQNSKLTKLSNKKLKSRIYNAVKKRIKKRPDSYFEDSLQTVKNTKLNDMHMYLSGKYIYVAFNYALGPIASGPTTVKIKNKS